MGIIVIIIFKIFMIFYAQQKVCVVIFFQRTVKRSVQWRFGDRWRDHSGCTFIHDLVGSLTMQQVQIYKNGN